MADFNSHPQPKTFAPSKEDVLQNLQYFFGAPVSPEKLKDYSEHHAMTCALLRLKSATHSRTRAPPRYSRVVLCPCSDHFPDAYAGQNVSNSAQTAYLRPHCSRLALVTDRQRSATHSTT